MVVLSHRIHGAAIIRLRCLTVFLSVLVSVLVLHRADAQEVVDRERVTFWMYASGSLGMELRKIAETFNQAQSQYHVDVMMVPWNSNQKVLSSIAAGIPPDVIMVDRPAAPGWVLRGALDDVTDLVTERKWSDEEFFSAPWRDAQYQGKFYLIPLYSDIRCLIYNKELFRQVGLDPDKPPTTWEELYHYARRLTRRDERGRLVQLGFAADYNLILVLGWQLGADLANVSLDQVTMDSAEYVEGLRYFKRLIDITGMDDYLRFLSASGSTLEAQDAFFMGKIAMRLVEGYYLVRAREFAPDSDIALAPFPMPNAAPPVSWISGFGLGIPTGARNRRGAWAFIEYMVSPPVQLEIARRVGQIPALRQAAYQPEIYDDPNRRLLIDMADRCRFYPKVPVIMEAYNETCKAVEAVLFGKLDPEQALAVAQRVSQKALDGYLAREKLPLLPWNKVFLTTFPVAAVLLMFFFKSTLRACRQGRMTRYGLLTGYAFVLPWLLGLVFFTVGPMFISFIYSFCDYQVLKPARWAGVENYRRLFTDDPLFWKSLWNTVYYTVFSVPLGMCLALALAILLNQPVRGVRIFRTIFYLPSLITGVAVAVLWLWILHPEYGVVNKALMALGFANPPLWFQSETWSKPALIFMSLWGVGGTVVIFLAGLKSIPNELYEAAEIDGAGAWRQFVHVTVPLLTPTIFFVLVAGLIGSFQVFTQAFVASGGQGGPLDSTLFYVFYLYRKGFEDFDMGYASALAWVLFAVIFIFTLIQLKLAKRWVHY